MCDNFTPMLGKSTQVAKCQLDLCIQLLVSGKKGRYRITQMLISKLD
jgi:hypothetical protein